MNSSELSSKKVYKKVLKNGLTILVRPTHIVPKVSVQLWYGVGSKNELSKEKGIAHFIEHMIFKGTDKLSESDINNITHKLSGYCNAFTSYDYTGYLFNFPTQHWTAALPIMADCMRNCTFKDELLRSEMKAVIQELKMHRDDYSTLLLETMVSTIFQDHPYHYPIIGFKQDLWSMKREDLVAFYKKHYVPNNATLVVTGDVEPENVYALAEKEFGSIEADPTYKQDTYHMGKDIIATSVTLYRDIKQPMVFLAYVAPGARADKDYALNVLAIILGQGKASRLYKKLVEELQIATELDAFSYDLFDQGLFVIYFQPKSTAEIEACIATINAEIEKLKVDGITVHEFLRARKRTESNYYSLLEDAEKQAYFIGQAYVALNDDQALFTYLDKSPEELKKDALQILNECLRPSLMHMGKILPLEKADNALWADLQKESDEQDAKILSQIVRTAPIEKEEVAAHIHAQDAAHFNFPQPKKMTLANGLTVFYLDNPNIEKIEVIVDLKAKYFYDPSNQQGLSSFISTMLEEGTRRHSAHELADEIETYGMTLNTAPGQVYMSMLSDDAELGLSLLTEVLSHSTFPESSLDKVRDQLLADLDNFWDTPTSFADQLAREVIYKGHPYEKLSLGTEKNIENFTRKDLFDFYQATITPQETIVAIVGDLSTCNIEELVKKTFGTWTGPKPPAIIYPPLAPARREEILYPINRDQVVLTFAAPSVARIDKAFDRLVLFDQILLGSMSSMLFALREHSGLFYTIGGSLLKNAGSQPGMIYIQTIVSVDRLNEAEKAIAHTIDTAIANVTNEQIEQAKNVFAHALVDNFESNRAIANSAIFLERHKLPADYFNNRALQLKSLAIDDIKKTSAPFLDSSKMIRIKIGRF